MSHDEKSVGGCPVSGHAEQTETFNPVESTGWSSLTPQEKTGHVAQIELMLDCIGMATTGLRAILEREPGINVGYRDVMAVLTLIEHAQDQAADHVDCLNVVGAP